jgi:uncharacterized protein
MRLDLDTNKENQYIINAYIPGQITINQQIYRANLIITPTKLITDWEPMTALAITAAQVAELAAMQPEVAIIGTGETLVHLHPAVLAPLSNQGIGVEVMITRSACYTYNILLGEGRRVIAALLLR